MFKQCGTLRITRFEVPATAITGQSIQFMCLYELGEDNLYSLKWYKNETEFFRFEPNGEKLVQVFPIPEITLDLKRSNNGTLLVATDISNDSTGNYKCEISADTSFLTVYREQMMIVLGTCCSS
ncbi:uncharacterized protein B4U80_02341 [Leptotrombidium deliense]|uniref:Ig-like domain-containing protein n=1 Tax=Leptotrombidium deliense TaxID=299467 RepID=A0A443SFG9_9ACAR|nr:uncharacterized protein B4U80_02341 [Leptotrombidium deliense]